MSGFLGRDVLWVGNTVVGMEMCVLKSYLIEAYVPNLDHEFALAITATLEAAADRLTDLGARVEWRVAIAIYAEETYLVVVAAPNEEFARRWSEAADLRIDHLTEVTQITGAGGWTRRPAEVATSRRPAR